jgi:hypothetical protein
MSTRALIPFPPASGPGLRIVNFHANRFRMSNSGAQDPFDLNPGKATRQLKVYRQDSVVEHVGIEVEKLVRLGHAAGMAN